jgi:hypothetical protein
VEFALAVLGNPGRLDGKDGEVIHATGGATGTAIQRRALQRLEASHLPVDLQIEALDGLGF